MCPYTLRFCDQQYIRTDLPILTSILKGHEYSVPDLRLSQSGCWRFISCALWRGFGHSPTSPWLSVPSLSGQAIQNQIYTPGASPTIFRTRAKPLLIVRFLQTRQVQRLSSSHRRSIDWPITAFYTPFPNVFCSLCRPVELHSSHKRTERPCSFVPIVNGRNQNLSPTLSNAKRGRPNGTRGRYWRKKFRVSSAEKFRTEHSKGPSFETQPNATNV